MESRRFASPGVLVVLCTLLAHASGCGEDRAPDLPDSLLLGNYSATGAAGMKGFPSKAS